MSITLRRPMFRGGKPEVYGTGITANLETRKNYAGEQQTQDAIRRQLAKQVGQDITQEMMPSYRDQIFDFITAFGASGSAQPQTFGEAASQTGINFQNIFAPKVAAAKKAGSEAYLSALKGADPQALALYQKQANDLFRISQQRGDGRFATLDDALSYVLQKEFEGKDTSQKTIEDIAKSKPYFKSDYPLARAEAETEYKMTRDPEFANLMEGRYQGGIDYNKFVRQQDGTFILRPGKTASKSLIVNDVYVDPKTKGLYYWDGKSKLIPLQ